MSRQKKQLRFHIDDEKVFDYMMTHRIKYLKDFYAGAGMTMAHYYHCQRRGILSIEHAWRLAEFMGVMIEDVVSAEEIEEEK
jgi:hypothetical protein